LKTKIINHKGQDRIKVDFPFNQEISNKIKKIPGSRWSQTHKAWHIPNEKSAVELLKTLFPEIDRSEKIVSFEVNKINQEQLIKTQEEKKPFHADRKVLLKPHYYKLQNVIAKVGRSLQRQTTDRNLNI